MKLCKRKLTKIIDFVDELNCYCKILLSVVSKVLERAVHKHLYQYLLQNNKLCGNQFGCRPGHSCETALLCMIDHWASNVDKGIAIGFAFIDFRKAFETGNHSILLHKLAQYGCSEQSIRWFQSYLVNRKQFVTIQDKSSVERDFRSGVLQGSVLGLLLFIILINDQPQYLSSCSVLCMQTMQHCL